MACDSPARTIRSRSVVTAVLAGLLALGLSAAAFAQGADEGVRGSVRRESPLAKMVPAEAIEQRAIKAYQEELSQSAAKGVLVSDKHPQVMRLRAIAQRLIPFTASWNPRAEGWNWEVNLIGTSVINASCMAGGKIVFYAGILQLLQLSDDEVAIVMGHEVAHALREHSRKHVAESVATNVGAGVVSSVLGLKELGGKVVQHGANLLALKFNRNDEYEADIVGLELAARAGYDPRAGVTLWQKMTAASDASSRPPEYRSTHPSGERRIQQIESMLPKVMPLYEAAPRPQRVYGPPAPAR